MPHLVQMDKKLRKKGLVIIGAESQGSSDAQIKKVTDNAKVEFTITKGVQGPVSVRGIPVALIFDVSGKMIFKGHPRDKEFDKTVKKALKEVKLSSSKAKKSNTTLVPQRKWTNTEGVKITASVTAVNGDEVTFKLYNSKVVKYQISKLSDADQGIIKLAQEAAAEE
ncbi:MAG: hypothetical protein ACI9E1_002418 [Cryomorphaceae bacterium]|jgi:hypothetical protein